MEKSRPYITLSAAISIDGKIATKIGDSKLSSKKDKTRVHRLRAKNDAILIGSNTVKQDNPMLTVRYAKGKNPIRIVLDSKAAINPKSRIKAVNGRSGSSAGFTGLHHSNDFWKNRPEPAIAI